MPTVYLDLVKSGKLSAVDPEVWGVYFCLLLDAVDCDTELAAIQKTRGYAICGYTVQTIAQYTGLNRLTILRHLDTLRKKRWVQVVPGEGGPFCGVGTYVDGELNLYCDVTKHPKISSVKSRIVKLAREKAARSEEEAIKKASILTPEMKSKYISETFGSLGTKRSPKTQVLDVFVQVYEEKYRQVPALCGLGYGRARYDKKAYVYAARCMSFVDDNPEAAKRLIEYIVREWDTVRKRLGGAFHGRPEINLFGSKLMLAKFSQIYLEKHGHRTTEGTEESTWEGPDVGW